MNHILNRSIKYFFALFYYLFFLSNLVAQRLPIAIDRTDVQIFPSANSQHEVHISINKTQPNNLIVSANTLIGNTVTQGHYVSSNSGITWRGSDRMPNNQRGAGDPSTSFDASGRAYISTMATNAQNQVDGYFLQFSDNQGVAWSNSIRGTGPKLHFDKEMITTVDEMQNSPFANNFYCVWTDFGEGSKVFLNRSTNRAVGFSERIEISARAGIGANVQTGPNGEVYVCWSDVVDSRRAPQGIGFSASFNGGTSFTRTDGITVNGIAVDNKPNPNFGGTRMNDFPAMAVDKSCGAHRGRIYIAYPELETATGTRAVIRVRFSDNQGVTWSNPTTISPATDIQSWFPWIAIDDLTGMVSVAYYSLNNNTTNTFLSFSQDGILWGRVKVSDVGHVTAPVPSPTVNNRPVLSEGYAGDYIGVAAFGGASYAAWADDRTGVWQIFVSRVDFNLPSTIASQTNLVVNHPLIITGNQQFQARNIINVANLQSVTVGNSSSATFVAGKEIMFHAGFAVNDGANFSAKIDDVPVCTTPGAISLRKKPIEWQSEEDILQETKNNVQLFAYPNPATDYITVGCINNKFKEIYFSLSDVNGKKIYENLLPDFVDDEQIRKILNVSKLNAGTYILTILIDKQNLSTKIIKQ
jgi:Secretion system C-terminal sorting domain